LFDLEIFSISMQLPQPLSSANSDLPLSKDVLLSKTATLAVVRSKSGAWSTFLSTFITIFLAEMGDKTQLATLLLSAQSRSPWLVFAGAGSALIATSLVGVLLGRYLAKVLSPKTLDIAAGGLLAIISLLLLWDTVRL
jgi:putative Ca2+/H+ antiporter (TMEM165/GDT1 family)